MNLDRLFKNFYTLSINGNAVYCGKSDLTAKKLAGFPISSKWLRAASLLGLQQGQNYFSSACFNRVSSFKRKTAEVCESAAKVRTISGYWETLLHYRFSRKGTETCGGIPSRCWHRLCCITDFPVRGLKETKNDRKSYFVMSPLHYWVPCKGTEISIITNKTKKQ